MPAARCPDWLRRPLPALALLMTAPIAHATPPTDISSLLDPLCSGTGVPGMVAVVLRGDQIVAQGAAGVRAAGSPPKVTIDDRFHLGSDTKAMTATLIAMLVEEGRLKWDTTIGEFFGPTVPDMNPAWRPVTLTQLLTHHAGAPHDLDADLHRQLWQRRGTPTEQRMQLVRGVLSRPPVNQPGTTYLYSNAGFAIAGAMAEKITGRPWEDLIQVRLFAPLGISSAGFGAPGTPGKLDQPLGHTAEGQPVPVGPQADNPPAIGPAGTVHLSLPDWARFIALHLRGDVSNPHRECRLLSPDSFIKLHHPIPDAQNPYAMGWLVLDRGWAKGYAPLAHGRALTHAGSNTMWFCVTWLAPERDFAMLVACNRGGDIAAKTCEKAVGALIKQFNPTP